MENLRNYGSYIETLNQRERDDRLLERIEEISLFYAEKKFQEIKKDNPSYKFSEAINHFTLTKNFILDPVFRLEAFNTKKYQKEIEDFLNSFYQEADEIYKKEGFDAERIFSLINLKKGQIKKYLGVESLQEASDREDDFDLIRFNQINNIDVDAARKYADLEKFGFSRHDPFMEVHVENFYKLNAEKLGPELIKKNLGKLAEYIIDKTPETRAIIGRSWLLDTPLAGRLGFKKIADENIEQNDLSTWYQFISKDGQIDQKRFNKFLETGELPYKVVRAYIPVEEFLAKYLPENRRGRIVLKEADKDRQDFWNNLRQDASVIKVAWEGLLENGGSFQDFIQNNLVLDKIFSFVSPEDKSEYLSFLKVMYDNKIPWQDFNEHKSEGIESIDAKINKFMKEDMFKSKEIIID